MCLICIYTIALSVTAGITNFGVISNIPESKLSITYYIWFIEFPANYVVLCQSVPRHFLTDGFHTTTLICSAALLPVLQMLPAVSQPVLTTAVVPGLIGTPLNPLECAAGFMAPGPVRK